jgi:hypothetical protein
MPMFNVMVSTSVRDTMTVKPPIMPARAMHHARDRDL